MGSLFFNRKRNIPKEDARKKERAILVLFALSILFFVLAKSFPSREADKVKREMIRASEIMAEATDVIRECRAARGLILDKNIDLNQTGLIGLDFSPITTSIGSLEAKRTTTNPNFAALIVSLLKEAKIESGDTIAVGASSSFPALIVAVLSAAKAMNLKPIVINSLGASQWGANNPNFHWLDMQNCLLNAGKFDARPIGLSLGGASDEGKDMSPEGRSFLINEIRERGNFFLHEPDLMRNVEARMRLYEEKAGESKIKAFINIGGSWPNMGEDPEILKLRPGLVKVKQFPPAEKRGVLFEMAALNIPVVHLLYIKGLVERYGLSWDPIPLPQPGKEKIYQLVRKKQSSFFFLVAAYLLLVIAVMSFRNKLGKR
ncbi:MAG: poly-gamma-glutamate system protein [Candidatus Aminicenantes bacterium]|nr:poly-gamma-glutamate system protein [Candidatus Aminicenantes bacterium]